MKPSIKAMYESLDTDDPLNFVNAFFSINNKTMPSVESRLSTAATLVFKKLDEQKAKISSLQKQVAILQKQLASHEHDAIRRLRDNLDYLPYDDCDYDR